VHSTALMISAFAARCNYFRTLRDLVASLIGWARAMLKGIYGDLMPYNDPAGVALAT
jgi:hypothetical protein